MEEDNIFQKLIKKYPCVSLMLLIIIITLLIVGFLYLINSSVFSTDKASVLSAVIAIVALILTAFVLDYLVKYFEKRSELKEANKPVEVVNEPEVVEETSDNSALEEVEVNQEDLEYIAVINNEITTIGSVPDTANLVVSKSKLYCVKSEVNNLYIELFISPKLYKFKLDCNTIKQIIKTTTNTIDSPYTLTIITNDNSRLVIRETYNSDTDNFNKIIESIKSINSNIIVTNEEVFEGHKVTFNYSSVLALDYRYSRYNKDISDRIIEHKIENILHEDITKIEYYNSIEEYYSDASNYLKICTNYCNYIILFDRKINSNIQDLEIIGLPIEQSNEIISRKWIFGKDDNGANHKYYDSMKETSDYEDIKLTYRKDAYILNQEDDENDLSKSFVATRRDGSTLEVNFYYSNKGFNKDDIKSKGQIMLISDDAPNSSAFEFFDYDCYPVERWNDQGDNLYIKNNYAFIYNTSYNYIVCIDIDDIKSIDCKKEKEEDYIYYSFEIYTNDGSSIIYTPLIEYGDKEDIIDTFLLINKDITINKL